jgi:hypothetical protein
VNYRGSDSVGFHRHAQERDSRAQGDTAFYRHATALESFRSAQGGSGGGGAALTAASPRGAGTAGDGDGLEQQQQPQPSIDPLPKPGDPFHPHAYNCSAACGLRRGGLVRLAQCGWLGHTPLQRLSCCPPLRRRRVRQRVVPAVSHFNRVRSRQGRWRRRQRLVVAPADYSGLCYLFI